MAPVVSLQPGILLVGDNPCCTHILAASRGALDCTGLSGLEGRPSPLKPAVSAGVQVHHGTDGRLQTSVFPTDMTGVILCSFFLLSSPFAVLMDHLEIPIPSVSASYFAAV